MRFKILFIVLAFASVFTINVVNVAAFSGTIGFTGSVHLPLTAVSDSPVSIQLTGLTSDADYILVSPAWNLSFTASKSRMDIIRSFSEQSSGVISIDLWGYNSTSGIAQGALAPAYNFTTGLCDAATCTPIDSATIAQTPKEDIAPSALFTGFIGIIVTIGVVFLLFKAFGGTGK